LRVSENTAFGRAIDYVRRSKEKLDRSQEKVGLMKRITRPSDDPIGTVRVLKLRGEKNRIDEVSKNISSARAFMEISDGALSQVSDILIRVKELAVGQAGDVGTSDVTRRAIADEVGQLYAQCLKLANTRLAGRYIFAGFRTDAPPFDSNGEYSGDSGEIKVEVSENVLMSLNVPGNYIFLGEERIDGNEGVNIFRAIENLRIGLLTNNTEIIQSTLDRLDESIDQNVLYRAKIGSRLNALERAEEFHQKRDIDISELKSMIEDVDMYKALSDLKKNESVLKTSLAASTKLIEPSLLDFLR